MTPTNRNTYITALAFVLLGALALVALLALGAGRVAAAPPLAQDPTPTPVAQPVAGGAAQAAAPTCDELQVILIADQSGSMEGFTDPSGIYHPPTDPDGVRFVGPNRAVELMALLRASGYRSATVRVAMIYFGDQAETKLNWTDVTPASRAEANALLAGLGPTFQPVPNLGNTVPGFAVEQASSLFGVQEDKRPQVDGCPLRLVILFTDGAPYSDDIPGFGWESHLAALARFVQAYMPAPDYRLYVIGADTTGQFFNDSLDDWAAVTGSLDRVLLAHTLPEVNVHLRQILVEAFNQLEGVGSVRGCAQNGQIPVRPYLQTLQIQMTKNDPSWVLDVANPDGVRLDDSMPGVEFQGRGTIIESVIVDNPQPGDWRILSQLPPEAYVQCLVDYVGIDAVAQVVSPTAGQRVTQFQSLPITFQLVDGEGHPLPDYDDPRFDAQMDVSVAAGNEDLALTLGANPGQQYRGEVIPSQPGGATLNVAATAQDPTGKSFTLFDEQAIATFEVTPARLVQRAGPTGGLRVGQHEELPLSFAIVDENDQVLDLDVPVEIQLSHQTADGQTLSPPALTETGGLHQGNLRLSEPGVQTLAYTATISMPAQGTGSSKTVALAGGEVEFEVFPVTLLHAEFISPTRSVATDMILRPTGLELEVQLVDEDGNPVSPGATGLADPTQPFDIIITDQDGNQLLQGADELATTGAPGRFRLRENALGRGDYAVSVRPAGEVGEEYRWNSAEWTTTATGMINPSFYYLLGGVAAALALVVLAAGARARAIRHPLAGTVQIYEQRSEVDPETGASETRTSARSTETLSRRNRHIFNPNVGAITRVELSSPNDAASQAGRAEAKIYRKGQKEPQTVPLVPGVPKQISGTKLFIVKDPRSGSYDAAGDVAPLDDTFGS